MSITLLTSKPLRAKGIYAQPRLDRMDFVTTDKFAVHVWTDVPGILFYDESINGINWETTESFQIPALQKFNTRFLDISKRYLRLRYFSPDAQRVFSLSQELYTNPQFNIFDIPENNYISSQFKSSEYPQLKISSLPRIG